MTVLRGALAAAAALTVAMTPLHAQPQTNQLKVGARFMPRPAIPQGKAVAILLMGGDWNVAIKVCEQYKRQYVDSLNDNRPYERMVYMLRNQTWTGSADCQRYREFYDHNAVAAYQPGLNMDQRGDGPFLVIVKREAGDQYVNMGFVNFADANDAQIRKKFSRFTIYYNCKETDWGPNRVIDSESFLELILPGGC